jgi:hypothetical protein
MSLSLDTSEIELYGYNITFMVTADGGASEQVKISLPVKCPDTV